MKTMINKLRKLQTIVVGALVSLATSLNTGAFENVMISSYAADAATFLLTAPLTPTQRQVLHRDNFYRFQPEHRALYLHAVAFQIGAIVAAEAPVPESVLAEYLGTADLDEFFDIYTLLPEEDETLIVGALREVNFLIANQIAGSAALQQAVQSGAVNGYISWTEGDWNGDLTPPTGGSGSLVDGILTGL